MDHISDTLRDLVRPDSPASEDAADAIRDGLEQDEGLPLGWESVEVVEP